MASNAQKNSGFLLPDPLTGYPEICVSFKIPDAPEYRAAVRGHLYQLGKWWNWERSGESSDRRATQTALIFRTLLEETLAINDQCFPDESGCLEYHNLSYIIEWIPNHPTDQTAPPGYLFPPWYIAPDLNLIGARPGAVVTDIARFPYEPGQPAESLPRFRIHLNGTGTVEIHLVTINFGGNAIIQVDGELSQIEVIDLNQDNIAIPPETEDIVIVEREITTPGAHFIDVTMTPVLQNEVPPVLFGGGLMKVVLCGFDDMARELDIRAIPAGDGCQQLQKKYTHETEWVDIGEPICNGADGREVELQMASLDELCQQAQWRYVGEAEWNNFGEPICNGAPGECPDCETIPDEDDGGVPDPDLTPDEDNACKVATYVANSMIDNYYVPALELFIEDILNNSGSTQDLARKLLRLGFFGGASLIQNILDIINYWFTLPAQTYLTDIQTPEKRELVICCLYCALTPNVDVTAQVFSDWRSCMSEENDDTLTDFVRFLDAQALATIRTEAALASLAEEAECDCDCDTCDSPAYLWQGSHLGAGVYQSISIAPMGNPVPHRISFSACPGGAAGTPPGLFEIEIVEENAGTTKLIRARNDDCYLFKDTTYNVWNSIQAHPTPLCCSSWVFANDAPFTITVRINGVLGGHEP